MRSSMTGEQSPNGYNRLSLGLQQFNAIKTEDKMAFGEPIREQLCLKTPFEAKLKDKMAYIWPFC